MKRKLSIIVAIVLISLIFDSPLRANSPVKGDISIGSKAPSFSVETLNKKKLSLQNLLEKFDAVVVNFWGLRCGACIQEMPHLNEIYKTYSEKVCILGINVDAVDGPFLVKNMKKIGISANYTIVPDPEFYMVDLFNMMAAPLTVVIDSKGVVRYRHENYEPGDEVELEKVINNIIQEANTAK